MIPFFRLVTLLFCLASAARAQEILMVDLGGTLASLDPKSGQVTIRGFTGVHGLFWTGMAMDSQGRLFASYGDWIAKYGIYEINPHTGQATLVVQTNLQGIRGLAFGPGDVLYAIDHRNAPLIDTPDDLHVIDLATGLTTFIGDTGSVSLGKITFAAGTLWGYDAGDGLVQIDTNTGVASDVNPLIPALPFTFPGALCSTTDDSLYYVGNHLWIMDKETGAVSQVALVSLFASWSGAVFVEHSTKPLSLWFGGSTGGPMEIKIAGGTPGGLIALAWADGPGGPTSIPGGFSCSGLPLDLNSNMRLLGTMSAGNDGKAILGPRFLPASASQRIRVQAVDVVTCRTSNVAIVWY